MIVVDSSVWIDNFRGASNEATSKLLAIACPISIIVGDIILLEVLRGARDGRHAARLEQELRRFPIEPMLDDDLAVAAARNYRRMRGRGVTVRKTVDLVIATYCLERGHSLLHRDRDFAPMVTELGLQVL